MKRTRFLCLALALLCLFGCSGCSILFRYKTNRNPVLASFPTNRSYPERIEPAGDAWFALLGTYENNDYSISYGKSLDDMKTIYEGEKNDIWFFEACEDFVVWSEKTADPDKTIVREFKIWQVSSEMTRTFATVRGSTYNPENIGIRNDRIYWCETNTGSETAAVMEYDVPHGTVKPYFRIPYSGETSIFCITVDEEYLTVAYRNEEKVPTVTVLSLDSGETVLTRVLPAWMMHVYAVSYDASIDRVAVYLYRSDKEECLYLVGPDPETDPFLICSFEEDITAFSDRVKCRNGHVYWVFVLHKGGYVSDHLFLADYDFQSDTITEYRRILGFSVAGETMHTISFNRRKATAVEIRTF